MATDYSIFNELSLRRDIGLQELAGHLSGLAELFKIARRFGIRRLRTSHDFRNTDIADGRQVNDAIMALDNLHRQVLLTILDSPYTPNDINELEYENVVDTTLISVNGVESNGFGTLCSLILQCLCVSLLSDSNWDTEWIELVIENSNVSSNKQIPHAAKPDHLFQHFIWLTSLQDFSKNPPEVVFPLPNTAFSDLLVGSDWKAFFEANKKRDTSEKNAAMKDMAMKVALANGYTYAEDVSKKNQNSGRIRQIFSSTHGRRVMYLSTDFESIAGAFEVFNHRGEHQGEFLFSGVKNKGRDASGKHDIEV